MTCIIQVSLAKMLLETEGGLESIAVDPGCF